MLLTCISVLATLSALASPSASALLSRGLQLASDGSYGDAVAALEDSFALAPDSETLVVLGLVWEEAGLPLKALESYVRAADVNPSNANAFATMGQLLETHMDDRAAAVAALRHAVALEPDRASAWNLLGTLLHSQGALDESLDALHAAIRLQPDDDDARRNLAAVLRSVGHFDEAIAQQRQADGEDCASASLAFAPDTVMADDGGGSPAGSGGRVAAIVKRSALPAATPPEWVEKLRKVHVTSVASEAECEWAIGAAERCAAAAGGWDGEGHHDTHKTNDIVVAADDALRAWVQGLLATSLWPAIEAQFGIGGRELWLEDCFVVKYEAAEEGGQPGLGRHADDSELSFNLLLSDPRSGFDGGGTAFADAEPGEVTVRPARGEALTHYGRLMHEGRPTLRGARYILAGFVRAKPLAEAWRELRPPEHEEEAVDLVEQQAKELRRSSPGDEGGGS